MRRKIHPYLDIPDMHIINQYNYVQADNEFIITINTSLGTGASFTLPLPSGHTYNFTVDYGDGSPLKTVTTYNDPDASYTYAMHGIYQIKIKGKCGGWSFNNGGDRLKITSVDNWGDVGFDNIVSGFFGCSNLTTVASDGIKSTSVISVFKLFEACSNLIVATDNLLKNLPNITTAANIFASCGNLTTINSDLFRYNVLLTNFTNAFYFCTSLTALPTDLFRYNISVTSFNSTFYACTSLVTLPEDLFYYNSLVTNYQNTFFATRNMVLPTRIFNLSNLSIVITFQQFMNCTTTGRSSTGTIQDIWNYATSAASTDAFLNQISLTNYSSIPFDWKGMVEVGTITTDQTTLQTVGINRTFTGIAEIHWGDDEFTRCTSATEATHDYSSTGTYTIKLGAASNTATTVLIADNSRITFIENLKTGLLTDFRIHNNLYAGILDMTNAKISEVFFIYNNPDLINVLFSSSGNEATAITANDTKLVTFDISNVPIKTQFIISNCSDLEQIIFATSGNTINSLFRAISCPKLSNLNLLNVPIGGTEIEIRSCAILETIIFATSGNASFKSFRIDNNILNYTDLRNFSFISNDILNFQNNGMNAGDVNHILVDLYSVVSSEGAGGDYTGRIIYAAGTNAAPDGSSGGYDGLTAKTNLESKGITVITS